MPDQEFNSAEAACRVAGIAGGGLDKGMTSRTAQQAQDAATRLYAELTNLRTTFGQKGIDSLGNQLDLLDLRQRIKDAPMHTSGFPRVCANGTEIPAVIVGRDVDNHVTDITFMGQGHKATTFNWKSPK